MSEGWLGPSFVSVPRLENSSHGLHIKKVDKQFFYLKYSPRARELPDNIGFSSPQRSADWPGHHDQPWHLSCKIFCTIASYLKCCARLPFLLANSKKYPPELSGARQFFSSRSAHALDLWNQSRKLSAPESIPVYHVEHIYNRAMRWHLCQFRSTTVKRSHLSA
jgi:hypothetical protein